mmetsp:Transcript_111541/g.221757  ORF Transcript_111541/g.221757 Transcript_111541/m.221757 type:complete len:167 (+) Transcript_111541:37-537(+)
MTQIFRIALLAAGCLVNCRSASIMQQGCVFATRATLPLLVSLVPATLSSAEEAGEDAGEILNEIGDDAADAEEDMEGDAAAGEEAEEFNPEDMMKDMDKDGDGFLSLDEVIPDVEGEIPEKEKDQLKKAFDVGDADKDGKLSLGELPGAIKEFEKMAETENPNEEM